ncbi:MAG TPA: manganese efflux pump MntP family protein [Phycisphaerae bacterium]|nr:manganese efflux pump MntP family protein [Phycisphaerae bacterium]HRY67024.1 manganese efflux pump MntP family protein [Phycisphaerae bacterium]HSA27721.1 manganese efflux pump MntP family protein [Phycisphaerae bacterium]
MSWLNILGIALGLSMDAFAVAIAAGMQLGRVTPREVFRLGWHFGLFQFLMPILGWWIGSTVAASIASVDHWIAAALLWTIGGKMLYEAWRHREAKDKTNPTKGWLLVSLSVATSIDAFAVGLSLAFLRISIWLPSVVIGTVTALLTCLGMTFGARVLGRWSRFAEILGGIILILIGCRILVAHIVT